MTPVASSTAQEARSAAYALFSGLVSSPFDAVTQQVFVPADLASALDVLEAALPYEQNFDALRTEARRLDDENALRSAAKEYGAIFEVGRDGPPLPIRQELLYDETKSAQKKEEVVRFYEHFSFPLHDVRLWAPDHLGVALEFQHFLAFREFHAATKNAPAFVLASRDFAERHLAPWTQALALAVEGKTSDPYLRAVFLVLAAFVRADLVHLDRLCQTVTTQEETRV